MKKLKLSYDTRKQILDRTQYYGLTGLGWILRGLTRVLFGSETWKGFSALSTSEWVRETTRYSLHPSTIAGIDKALKDNLSPEEALDRLARKAGISKKVIKDSKLQPSHPSNDIFWNEDHKDFVSRVGTHRSNFADNGELTAEAREKLEKDIAASIPKPL